MQLCDQVGLFYVFQLDDWVLCRIYKKKQTTKTLDQKVDEESCSQRINKIGSNIDAIEQQQLMKFPRTCSLTHLRELEYFGPIAQLLSDNTYNFSYDFQNATPEHVGKVQLGEIPNQYTTDSGKFQVSPSGIVNQTVFVNPMVYEFQ